MTRCRGKRRGEGRDPSSPKSRNVTPGTNQGAQGLGVRAAASWGHQDTHLKGDALRGRSGCAGTGARKVGKSWSCWRGSSDGDTDDMDCHQRFPGTPWTRLALCWGCSSSPVPASWGCWTCLPRCFPALSHFLAETGQSGGQPCCALCFGPGTREGGGLCEFVKEKQKTQLKRKEKKNPKNKNPSHFSCNESGPYTAAQDRSDSTAPGYNSLPLLMEWQTQDVPTKPALDGDDSTEPPACSQSTDVSGAGDKPTFLLETRGWAGRGSLGSVLGFFCQFCARR